MNPNMRLTNTLRDCLCLFSTFAILMDFKIIFSRPKVTLDLHRKNGGTAEAEGTKSAELTARCDGVLDTVLIPSEITYRFVTGKRVYERYSTTSTARMYAEQSLFLQTSVLQTALHF